MKLIAITPELPIDNETRFIADILDAGFDYVHLRKPDYSLSQLKEYISSIPTQYHSKLKLHSHFSLANEFNVAGLHLNQRFCNIPSAAPERNMSSRSAQRKSGLLLSAAVTA